MPLEYWATSQSKIALSLQADLFRDGANISDSTRVNKMSCFQIKNKTHAIGICSDKVSRAWLIETVGKLQAWVELRFK